MIRKHVGLQFFSFRVVWIELKSLVFQTEIKLAPPPPVNWIYLMVQPFPVLFSFFPQLGMWCELELLTRIILGFIAP